MDQQVDVVVIGLGPGGEEAAGSLALAGLHVVGIEKELVGGECPYWGCVPSKMMIRAANLLTEGSRIPGIAGLSSISPDWAPVAHRIRAEATDNWDDAVAVKRLLDKGGRFVRGAAQFVGPRSVAVGGEVFEARRAVIIATGTTPSIPPIDGLKDVDYWTNRQAIECESVPKSLVVLGGGAIGAELGQVYSRFGTRVTIVEAAPHLLPQEEPEAGAIVAEVFAAQNIDVRLGLGATRVESSGDTIKVHLKDGGSITAERLLVATGRRPNTEGLNLEHAGVTVGSRGLEVDDRLRAGDGLWAIGDVAGKGAFTHMAMYHAGIVVADILGQEHHAAEYHAVPRVTFTDPEVGSVGLSEKAARDQGLQVRTGTSKVSESARGWIHKAGNEGIIKLVEDNQRGVLVGATAMGPSGGEVLAMLTLAVHAEIPVSRLREMIFAYPTFHRGVEDALRDLLAH